MKQLLMIALLILCGGCACSANQNASASPLSSSDSQQTEKKAVDVTGEETQFGTPIVSLTLKDGKLTELTIDELTGESTKKQMGDAYQLPDAAVDTWSNQIAFLEDYILKHDINQIQTDESGKAVDSDLLSGCTIQIDSYLKTIRKAMSEAK